MTAQAHVDVRRDNEEQIAEALGNDNRWYTGEAVGREPTPRECLEHYIAHGGAADFRRRRQAGRTADQSEEDCQG